MTEEEKKARKRAYHTEWQRRNPDKCREYHRRCFEKKAERYLREKNQRGESNER